MLPYLALLVSSVMLPLVFFQKRMGVISFQRHSQLSIKRNQTMISLFFLGLFVLLALRDITVGKDIRTYEAIFHKCSIIAFDRLPLLQWELGYTIYNKIVASIFNNYRFFLIITAAIVLIPIYKLYSMEAEYSYLVIIIFINMPCFLMIFSGLRQAIAISLGVVAYMLIKNKRYLWSILVILLAVSFHTSAGILVLLYPAYVMKIRAKQLLYIIPIIVAIYLFRVPILEFAISLMPSHYVEFYGEIEQTGAFGMMVLFILFSVFAFIVCDEAAMSPKDYFMRNILLVATVFQMFVPIHGLIQRASYYFLVFVPLSIICIMQSPKKYLKSISNLATIVIGCFFTLYFFYNAAFSADNLLDVFPYKFFWSGQG